MHNRYPQNIILIGYRCSGKSTVGRIISQKLNMDFLDTDEMIERHELLPIGRIVEEKGWDYFRKLEKKVVADLSNKNGVVVATGGGVILDDDNVRVLKANGWIVWLKADAPVLKQRMREQITDGVMRPSLSGGNPIEELDDVYSSRISYYNKAADFIVETSMISPGEVAEIIITEYKTALSRGAHSTTQYRWR